MVDEKGKIKRSNRGIIILIVVFLVVIGLIILISILGNSPSPTGNFLNIPEKSEKESEPKITTVSEEKNTEVIKDIDLDPDKDGLNTEYENRIGTNSNNPDTDGDGLYDGDEIDFKTNPLQRDSDNDGLDDGKEVDIRSNPLRKDTDGDGIDDSKEFYNTGTDLLKYDTDNDGLSDGAEINTYETKPTDGDSDNDGLNDGKEIERKCNPLNADTDGDGYGDYSDLFCYKDAKVRLRFTYLIMDSGSDILGDEADPYIVANVYNGGWETFESSPKNGQRQVTNPFTTEWINIPDDQKDVSMKVGLFDYDTMGNPDEADVNPAVETGSYSFTYDITSGSENIELDGNKDGVSELNGVLKFVVETS